MIDHYAQLLKQQYDEVWLGGFSTGGNLVSIHALDNQGVVANVIFTRFSNPNASIEKLTPLAAIFTELVYRELDACQI